MDDDEFDDADDNGDREKYVDFAKKQYESVSLEDINADHHLRAHQRRRSANAFDKFKV